MLIIFYISCIFYIQKEGPMQKILLMSGDASLAKELTAVLPKGFALASARPRKTSALDGPSFLFFDIDSVDIHRIKEYSEKVFVIAVKDQEKTGPVMEAATWGA